MRVCARARRGDRFALIADDVGRIRFDGKDILSTMITHGHGRKCPAWNSNVCSGVMEVSAVAFAFALA